MARVACSLSIVFFFLAIAFVFEVTGSSNRGLYRPVGGEGSVPIEECPEKCGHRCSATSHKKPCLKYCNNCCQRCLCVPSGTSGNKEECPCYNNMKTKEGKPKCP